MNDTGNSRGRKTALLTHIRGMAGAKLLFMLSLAIVLIGGALMLAEAVVDDGEEQHLIFMREEEKLARDVYLTLAGLYPEEATFARISQSEQRHMDTMLRKLVQYGIPDPSTDDTIGVFTGQEYGDYFTAKFGALVAEGSASRLRALYVGALIEELDMHDIVQCPVPIVQADNGIGEGECGLDYTDEKAIAQSLTNLLEGSKDHLRAFVRNIENMISPDLYQAQYLTQE